MRLRQADGWKKLDTIKERSEEFGKGREEATEVYEARKERTGKSTGKEELNRCSDGLIVTGRKCAGVRKTVNM